ncbi:MAG: sugar transferase [Nitrolancea sp.]
MNRRHRGGRLCTRRSSNEPSSNTSSSEPSGGTSRGIAPATLDGMLLGFVLYVTLEISALVGRIDPTSTTSFGERMVVSGVAGLSLTMIIALIGPSRIATRFSRSAIGALAASVAFSLSIASVIDALVLHLGVLGVSPEFVVGGMIGFSTIVTAQLAISQGPLVQCARTTQPAAVLVPTSVRSASIHDFVPDNGSTTFAATRSTRAALAHETAEAEDLTTVPTPRQRLGHGAVHLLPVEVEAELAEPVPISPTVEWPRRSSRSFTRKVKRATDLAVAVTFLVVLSPLLAALAILIKIESRGPALFVQARVGLNGKTFNLLKFRSMRCDAEECTGPIFAKRNDPRCTRVGRFMRRHSLDELPQLINVVTGDMSIVGPRPERPYFVVRFSQSIPHYAERHREKAGITGWAQVNGRRGDTSIEERVHYDLFYVENWSLTFDVKIMVRTVVEIFRGHNAY